MKVSRLRLGVEIGLTVALTAVLGLLKLWQMPQGGDISLAMLPLFVLALLRGPAAGMIAGGLYGVVDYMMEPYFVHPVQVLLDYPLAFAAVGLAGVFAARWGRLYAERKTGSAIWTAVVPGVALGAFGRYAAHVLSGLVFFASYAPKGQAPLVYSMIYNSFVLVSAVADVVVASAVLPPLQRLFGGARS